MSGPLAGLRVIDCSRGLAGPRATGLLADYGADVVWVEPPGGDPCRDELAVAYSAFNRGKRSLVLDLKSEGDRAALLDLLGNADVFVESWRPGVADRLGLDSAALRARFPRLVCCSISGFGQDGPHRDTPGYEAIVHAVVGTMAEQVGHREGPIFEALPFASIGAAFLAMIGILGALYRRNEEGAGRHVETSLLDGALAYLSISWSDTDTAPRQLGAGAYRLVATTFRCADDVYIGVHTGAVGAFGRLMKVLGFEDRIPPSKDGLDMGVPLTPEQKQLLDSEMHAKFESESCDAWLERLLDADICAVPNHHPGEVFDAPQVVRNGMVVDVEDPALGPIAQVGPPIHLTATPAEVVGAAPVAGQHDARDVLDEWRATRSAHFGAEPIRGRDDCPLLDGIRILDLGQYYAGPYSSRLLADLGADVIKLEPIAGDQQRGLDRVFRSAQAGKRSIAVNLKQPEGQAVAAKLVEWADVVHHNMRPGAAERLGMGFEQVRSIDPAIVYLHAPGWGSSGPNRDRQSFAPMLSGYVGVGFEVAGRLNPPLFPAGHEDPGNGLLGAVGILMGLLHRQRTGRGQLVENPQLNAALAHMVHVARRADGTIIGAERLDPLQLGFGPLERLYETADGWLCLVAASDEQFERLARVVGPGLLRDERFATRAAREVNDYPLGELLADFFRERATDKCLSELRAAGVPATEPVPRNSVPFLRDPENQRSGRVAECAHPTQGHVRELAVLVRVSGSRPAPHRLAPELGAHTDEVLSSLGRSAAQIADLRARAVVR